MEDKGKKELLYNYKAICLRVTGFWVRLPLTIKVAVFARALHRLPSSCRV